ncbi:MAG: GNAT family N-acetyltransferase [Clostridium sp.]|uniref:GNAT family N-acetyltransferase n=1 Tax=Clostridium TaxID=1485 RepID=UPI0028FECCF1|nr:GNAT family N-acetyltransferase [Clostridium sp.]MDU1280424.1 GNAT family N-acetyltransferase [Clostridium sp.]
MKSEIITTNTTPNYVFRYERNYRIFYSICPANELLINGRGNVDFEVVLDEVLSIENRPVYDRIDYIRGSKQVFDELLISNNIPFLIFAYDKVLNDISVGYILLGFNKQYKTTEISLLYVAEGYRNKNIGSNLLELAILIAKENNITTITLKTLESQNYIVNLYKKFGFSKNRIIPNRPGDVGEENFVEYTLKL